MIAHFQKNGIYPREHGLKHCPVNKKTLKEDEIIAIVSFIRRFANSVAITLPGRLPQHRKFNVLKLPSCENKSTVYRKYAESVPAGSRVLKLRTFQQLWADYCPNIVTMKPAYDLCEVCHTLSKNAAKTVNVSEDEKAAAIQEYSDHLNMATTQREFYNDYRTMVRCDLKTLYPGLPESEYLVISMDFAQNVNFPSGPQQVGTSYFKSARKAAIFGITNKRANVQHIFCIDESDMIGKGPNCVLSMLDYYLKEIHPTKRLIIFADNCAAQNKNNTVLRSLQHLVDTSKVCSSVELHFLLTGHTKFSPDRLFGVFKLKYASMNIDCFSDVLNCVEISSSKKCNVPVAVRLPNSVQPTVIWKDYDQYFKSAFKKLPGISKFHHFVFAAKKPIMCRKYVNTDVEEFDIHVDGPESNYFIFGEPSIVVPSGLSAKRQWYLYKNVRVLCLDDSKRDAVAPLPEIDENYESDPDDVDEPTSENVSKNPVNEPLSENKSNKKKPKKPAAKPVGKPLSENKVNEKKPKKPAVKPNKPSTKSAEKSTIEITPKEVEKVKGKSSTKRLADSTQIEENVTLKCKKKI